MKRPGAVTLLSLLLLLQAAGLSALGALYISWLDWQAGLTTQTFIADLPLALRGMAFLALSLLGLLAAIGFLRLWRNGWVSATLLQGLSLSIALAMHLQENPPFYAYLLMTYSVFMVIYLNYSEVTNAFRPQRTYWSAKDEL